MERRKFVIGLGALAAGGTAAVGSGAFSATEASRDLSVHVASDSSGYLKFRDTLHNDNNDIYADIEENQLQISFDNNGYGDGVNENSVNYFHDVFGIGNQGTEKVKVWFEINDEQLKNHIDFYPQGETDNSIVGEENAHDPGHDGHTAVGESFEVGVKIDLSNSEKSAGDVLGGEGAITVHAKSVESRYH